MALWRGALGGLLGNFAKSIIIWVIFSLIYPKKIGYFGTAPTVLLFVILGIPSSIIMGVIIAVVIRAINLKKGYGMGFPGRAAIGAGIVCALRVVIYLYDILIPAVNRWSADNFSAWMIASLFYIDFGVIIGATAGLTLPAAKAGGFLGH